jgi:activator of HSP90 ATPase
MTGDRAMTPSNEETAADRRKLTMRVRMSPYTGPTTNISQRVTLGAAPHVIYETLLDAEKHSALTGQPVEIGHDTGDPVRLGGGETSGFVMELLEDRHIVFALCSSDGRWPAKHYSTATFMLRPEGKGTTMVLFEQDVPEDLAGEITDRWQRGLLRNLETAFPL